MVTRLGAILHGSASSSTSWRRGARSAWHFAQMVLAMAGGMAVYHALQRTVLASTRFPAWALAHPLLEFWVMVVAMTLPMVALMAIHRHSLRYCLEMTASMLAPIALLSVPAATGLLPIPVLRWVSELVMVLSMAGYAVYRSRKRTQGASPEVTVEISDVGCAACARGAAKVVGALAGVESVTVDVASRSARVRGTATIESIRRALEEAGYEIKRDGGLR